MISTHIKDDTGHGQIPFRQWLLMTVQQVWNDMDRSEGNTNMLEFLKFWCGRIANILIFWK